MNSQTFPNGQTLASSALNIAEITSLFQQATCLCFGISNKIPFDAVLTLDEPTIQLTSVVGISVGFRITDAAAYGGGSYGGGGYGSGGNIPPNTFVGAILDDVISMVDSNGNPVNALASIEETIFITDPTAGNQVRNTWQTSGAPAWGNQDNVSFVSCTEVDNDYNKVRDEGTIANDDVSLTKCIEYTRVWRVFWELRGPTSYNRATLLKTAMQLDFIHDMLAPFNLYLMPRISNPRRVPELVEGKWWERADIEMEFYEQVNETIVLPTVASVEIQLNNSLGVQSDFVVTT